MAQYIDLVQKSGSGNTATYNETYVKQNLPREIFFSLASGSWNTDTSNNTFYQNVTVNGITADSTGIAGLRQGASAAQCEAANKAQLRITDQTTNQITVTAYGDKPTVNLPCMITCSSNMKLYRATNTATSDTVKGS